MATATRKAKAAKPRDDSDEVPTPADEKLCKIQDQNKLCKELRADYQQKKDASLASKKALDENLQILQSIIDEDEQGLPPFDEPKGKKGKAAKPAVEEWRSVEIELFGLSPALTAKLRAVSLFNLGKLADYLAAGNDLEGIGLKPAESAKVQGAIVGYLREQDVDPSILVPQAE
jgi:hypothetical protein